MFTCDVSSQYSGARKIAQSQLHCFNQADINAEDSEDFSFPRDTLLPMAVARHFYSGAPLATSAPIMHDHQTITAPLFLY